MYFPHRCAVQRKLAGVAKRIQSFNILLKGSLARLSMVKPPPLQRSTLAVLGDGNPGHLLTNCKCFQLMSHILLFTYSIWQRQKDQVGSRRGSKFISMGALSGGFTVPNKVSICADSAGGPEDCLPNQ